MVLANFLLQPGLNNIRIQATDALGNSKLVQRNINYLNNAGQRLIEVQGNNQSGLAGMTLSEPLVVKLVDRNNLPIIDRAVSFKVKEGDGSLSDLPREGRELTLITNQQGLAQVNFRLGGRHGAGKHQVVASSIGFPAGILFSASAQTLPANRISVSRGNYQTGMMDSALPEPIVARVVDVNGNPVNGVSVKFSVAAGEGSLVVNATGTLGTQLTAQTDIDGNVSAEWLMGNNPNKTGTNSQIVNVGVVGSQGTVALNTKFIATNLKPGPIDNTRVTGIVLDNSNQPLAAVAVTLSGDHFASLRTTTDEEGRFKFLQAPIGTVHLGFDGSTTSRTGEYPKLMYELVTISGQENTVGIPVYIPTLNLEGSKIAGGSQEVIIAMAGVEGAEVIIAPNSVELPDGRSEGRIMFSQVQTDKVPMPAPNGSVFDVAWTLQPSGTQFNPPARISLPNANGGKPGEEQEMFSFDHDLMEWVSIGPGVVSDDGSRITSREGFGVRHAGWGGAPPPPPPPTCNKSCEGSECYNYPNQSDCSCGSRELIEGKKLSSQEPDDCKTLFCGKDPTPAAETVAVKQSDICNKCEGTKVVLDKDQKFPDDQQKPDDCKVLFCGKDPEPAEETEALQAKGGDYKCKLCENADIENVPNESQVSCGDGSIEQSCYTCKDGSCGNHCEAEKGTRKFGVGNSILENLGNDVSETASRSPYVDLAFSGVRVEAFTEEGMECCENCDKGTDPVPYTTQGGSLAGSIGLVVVPGLGVAVNLPEKKFPFGFFGSVVASGKVIFGLSGKAQFAVNGQYEDKNSECVEDDCTVVSASAGGSINVGVRGEVEGALRNCASDGVADCTDLFIAKGNAKTVFDLPINVEAKRKVGGASCSGSCVGYTVGGVNFVAGVGYEFIIGGGLPQTILGRTICEAF